MTGHNVELDERAVAVDNRAGNVAFQVVLWMLLADMALRSWRPEWTMLNGFPVDVVTIMLTGATVHTIYNIRARTIGARRARNMLLSALTAAACAAAIIIVIKLLV
ncbi:MAG TPA: hypothetical protein VD973_29120 [Symbiobacteriaceae bacterium]|nr:hypothetical protein [Symbiobacteriaceae bacterium]